MRIAPALFAVAALAGVASADDSITLHRQVHKAGEKWTEDKNETSALDVSMSGQKIHVTAAQALTKSIEVTKVADGVVTEAKYTYATYSDKHSANGKETVEPAPIVGKSYKLTAGSPIGVAATSGTAADAEVALVRKLERRFGQADKMDKVLDGKVFARGKTVDLPSSEIAEAFGDDDGMKAASMSLTYRGTDGGKANFDVTLKIEGDKNNLHLSSELAGKVVIDPKTNELVSMELKGPMKGTGSQASLDGNITIASHTKH